MAIKTTLEQIEDLQEAISQAEGSQELSDGVGGRVVRPDLQVMYNRLDQLMDRYRRETGTGGPAINVGIMRRGADADA
jgi:hypothetical protein